MKKYLKKTILSFTLIIATIGVSKAENNNLTKSITNNNLGKPESITVTKDESNYKQYKFEYTDLGELTKKEVYLWNKITKNWDKSDRYIYEYNKKNELAYQIIQKWDETSDIWLNNGYMIYNTDSSFIADLK